MDDSGDKWTEFFVYHHGFEKWLTSTSSSHGYLDIYRDSRHPYTLGLLSSVPRLDAQEGVKLDTIEGTPPDLINMPQGCAFQPRCAFAVAACGMDAPALPDRGNGHTAACFIS